MQQTKLEKQASVVGSRNWITPCAEQEDAFFPQPSWILDAIHERILPLKDHTVGTNQTTGEAIRRNRLGALSVPPNWGGCDRMPGCQPTGGIFDDFAICGAKRCNYTICVTNPAEI